MWAKLDIKVSSIANEQMQCKSFVVGHLGINQHNKHTDRLIVVAIKGIPPLILRSDFRVRYDCELWIQIWVRALRREKDLGLELCWYEWTTYHNHLIWLNLTFVEHQRWLSICLALLENLCLKLTMIFASLGVVVTLCLSQCQVSLFKFEGR